MRESSTADSQLQEKTPDWRPSAASNRLNVLRRCREAGPAGVLNIELYAHPELYGVSPRNRCSELAKMGYVFKRGKNGALGVWEGRGKYRYTLIGEPEIPRPLPDYYAQKKIPWEKRPGATGLELFDAAVRP